MTKKAQWLKADGTASEVMPANGKDFTLEEMQKFVGGYVELINLRDGREMYVNEDGKLKRLPANYAATNLFRMGDTILGDVLVCSKGMVK